MLKFYQKSEIWFAVFWIIVYVVGTGLADGISTAIGVASSVTAAFHLIMTAILLIWIFKNNLQKKYGLCKSEIKTKYLLFYLPLFVLVSINFWFGINIKLSVIEVVLYIVSMLCVGFLEEIIFRGFLFKAMEKDSLKRAIIVSSITFGIGHIVNLLSNMGTNIVSNLCQVVYAIAVGFLFVIIFYKGKSLLPCIFAHGLFNAFAVFSNGAVITGTTEIIVSLVIVALAVIYSLIIIFLSPKETEKNESSLPEKENE